jgi:hypothetical protein
VLEDDGMSKIETNIFPILNVGELTGQYDTYRVRNLRRDQDEYFQNRESLVRDLSFKLQVPVQIIEREHEHYLVVRDDAADVPAKVGLVRTYVYLDKVDSGTALHFRVRSPENDAICLRFVQFMLQAPLRRNTRLWQPAAGMASVGIKALRPARSSLRPAGSAFVSTPRANIWVCSRCLCA